MSAFAKQGRRWAPFVAIGFLLVSAAVSSGQNVLVNGGFETPPNALYYDGSDPGAADDVLGWVAFLGAQDGSYVLISADPDPLANGTDADTGIGPGRGGLKTAPGSRPAVGAGTLCRATVTSDNYFSANATSYFIDFFDAGGSLISSTGGPLVDTNGPLVYAPYTQLYEVLGLSPAGCASAGVRFESGDASYAGLAADHFTLELPEPGSVSLLAIGGLALLRRRSRA